MDWRNIEDTIKNLSPDQRERFNTLENRIDKLINLAKDNPEKFEAEAARAKAEKLIEERESLLLPKDEPLSPEQEAASEAFDRAEDLHKEGSLHVSVSRTSDRPDAEACYCHISDNKGEPVFHAPIRPSKPLDPEYAKVHGYDLPAIQAAKPLDDYIKDISKAMEKAPAIGFDSDQDARAFDNTLAKIKDPAALPYARLARTCVANLGINIRNMCSTAVYELHHWREPLLIKAVRIAVQTVGAAFGYAPPMDRHIKTQSYVNVIREYRRERREYMERMDPPLKTARLEKEGEAPWRPTGTFSKERAGLSLEERMVERHLTAEMHKRMILVHGKELTVKEAKKMAERLRESWDKEANRRMEDHQRRADGRTQENSRRESPAPKNSRQEITRKR